MRRAHHAVLGLLVVGCIDAPLELPPDPGGPTTTGGDAADGETEGEPGDGDGDPSTSGDGDPSTSGDGDPSTSGDGDPTGGFSFGAPILTQVFAFSDVQLADLDADGCADLVLVGTGFPPRINVYPSACDGSFVSPTITHELTSFDGLALGDLDGDGRADVLTRGTGFPPRIEARRSSAEFGLGPAVTSQVYTYDLLWAIDVTGDGRAEAITHAIGAVPPRVFVWASDAAGNFTELAASEVGSFDAAAVGRIDADVHGDLLTGLGAAPVVNPWLGHADGSFTSGALFWPFSFSKLALGDLDGDGRAELLTDVPGNDWRVTIYANVGAGFGGAATDLSAVSYTHLRSADVDGDGRDDVVLAPTGAPPRVMVWLAK